MADRTDEFVERVLKNDGVLSQGDGLSTSWIVMCAATTLWLLTHEDEGGHQPILVGRVGVSEQMLELLNLFVDGFSPGGVSSMRRDLQLGRPGQESGQQTPRLGPSAI